MIHQAIVITNNNYSSKDMDDFLTTRQVLTILKVDRITIYRMLQDGRIKGVKVGQQWRFPKGEVERIVGGIQQSSDPVTPKTESDGFPTHCVQTIQDLFSEVGQVSALIVDTEGEPLSEISHACRYCQIILQTKPGQAACRTSWKEFARQSSLGNRYFTCHAGIQYISAPISNNEKEIGYFLVGEFYWQEPNRSEEAERSQRLAHSLGITVETLTQAANTIQVIETKQHPRVETWPVAAAQAVQTIFQERIGFIERLQQIANLTKLQ
jgi:excisionase family DNA binding protein